MEALQTHKHQALSYFREYLSHFCALSDMAWKAFSQRLNYLELPKHAILTHFGEIEDKIYFVCDGLIREFVRHGDKEFSIDFSFQNDFSSSITSFLLRRPSKYALQTLMPSQFLVISYSELNWLYENYPEMNAMGRKVTELLLVEKRQREFDLLTKSASERYMSLIDKNPEYVQAIPLKHVASFLGVAPESLSRIRAKYSTSNGGR